MSRLEQLLDAAAGSSTEPAVSVREVASRMRQRRRRRTLFMGSGAMAIALVALTVGLGLRDVGGDDGGARIVTPPTTAPVASENDFEGAIWILVEISGVDVAGQPLDQWIEFEPDGSVRGSDGCNDFGGTWSVEGDELVADQGFSRLAGCPPVQQPFLNRLWGRSSLTRDGDRLDLTARGGRLVFRRLSSLAAPTFDELVGAWNPDFGVSIRFNDDGRIDASSCGTIGTWELVGRNLSINDLATAECTDAPYALAARNKIYRNGDLIYLKSERGLLVLAPTADEPAAPTTTATTPPELRPAPPTADELLVGRWTAVAITGVEAIPPHFAPSLTLRADGTWSKSDGCNGTFGTWSAQNGQLDLERSGVSTAIACPPAQQPFNSVMSANPTIVHGDDPNALELVAAEGTVLFVRG